MPFALLVTGLVVGGLALLLALNTASAANELQRRGLLDKDSNVAARVQGLQVRVAASKAPGALAAAAAAMGMVPAGNPAFVVIGQDGAAKVMGRPETVTAPPVPLTPGELRVQQERAAARKAARRAAQEAARKAARKARKSSAATPSDSPSGTAKPSGSPHRSTPATAPKPSPSSTRGGHR